MSDLLSIGASGVRAFQGALTTTSENIANSGVAGYSRRTAAMSEVLTGADVSGRLTSFYTSATALAADPASGAQRSVMLENAGSVAAGFAATGSALTQVMADLDQTADSDAATLSTLASRQRPS